MADSRYPVPPEEYSCPLCAGVLRDPVTIPCGDTYCLECIKIYWDQADHLGVYSCPQCRATFTPRPVLRRNVPNVAQDCHQLPELSPFPYLQRDSLCDFCIGRKSKAVKSCLMCLAYYCETHIKPHYESSTFKKHKLVDETGHLERKICPQHEKGLELFCRSDQMCICVLCTVREHRSHNIVSADEERAEKQKVLVVTQAEVQHIIQDRMKELQELRHNVEVLKSCSQRTMSDCNKIFTEMAGAVERWRSEINSLIEANEQAAMSQAEGYVERLEQEIMELQRRDMELRHILETEDNIHFLQNFPTLCVPPEPMVPKVLINSEFSFGEVSKTVTDMKEHLEDICKKEQSKISKKISETPVYILLPRNGGRNFKAPSRKELQEPQTRADFLKCEEKMVRPQTRYQKAAAHRRSTQLTGGGQLASSLALTQTDERVSALIGSASISGITGGGGDTDAPPVSELDNDSCRLTLDPNTAYRELVLSDGNCKVTRKRAVQFYPDHPERFDSFSQVLCREPLSGFRYYWEVQWSGEFSIGVAYKSINRKGKNSSSLLGYNDKSWSLLCSDTGYSAWHNKMDKDLPSSLQASRIGVYLDYAGGLIAFYAVSDSMQLIHRFQAHFSEPLFAGFGVGSSVSICHLKANPTLY